MSGTHILNKRYLLQESDAYTLESENERQERLYD